MQVHDWEIRRLLRCSQLNVQERFRACLRLRGGELVTRSELLVRYKELRLKVHPDKNTRNTRVATEAFQFLQDAKSSLIQ